MTIDEALEFLKTARHRTGLKSLADTAGTEIEVLTHFHDWLANPPGTWCDPVAWRVRLDDGYIVTGNHKLAVEIDGGIPDNAVWVEPDHNSRRGWVVAEN